MKNLITMLREIDLEKNDIETIRTVLDYIANKLKQKEKDLYKLKQYIVCTKEYYHDGVDEELQDEITRIINS